jgi:hypothetical protein
MPLSGSSTLCKFYNVRAVIFVELIKKPFSRIDLFFISIMPPKVAPTLACVKDTTTRASTTVRQAPVAGHMDKMIILKSFEIVMRISIIFYLSKSFLTAPH